MNQQNELEQWIESADKNSMPERLERLKHVRDHYDRVHGILFHGGPEKGPVKCGGHGSAAPEKLSSALLPDRPPPVIFRDLLNLMRAPTPAAAFMRDNPIQTTYQKPKPA